MNDNDRQRQMEQDLHDLGAAAFPDDVDLRPAIHRRLAERHAARWRHVLTFSKGKLEGVPTTVGGWRLLPAAALALFVAIAGLTLVVVQPWDTPAPDRPDASWIAFSQESLLAMQRLEMIAEHGLEPVLENEQDERTPSQP